MSEFHYEGADIWAEAGGCFELSHAVIHTCRDTDNQSLGNSSSFSSQLYHLTQSEAQIGFCLLEGGGGDQIAMADAATEQLASTSLASGGGADLPETWNDQLKDEAGNPLSKRWDQRRGCLSNFALEARCCLCPWQELVSRWGRTHDRTEVTAPWLAQLRAPCSPRCEVHPRGVFCHISQRI